MKIKINFAHAAIPETKKLLNIEIRSCTGKNSLVTIPKIPL